jgi:radical SAM superfamily enzyme YgiQ (UPF0313 family)
MKILLVQPPCYVGDPLSLYVNDYSFQVPQLGLLYLAASVTADHDVKILDMNLEQTELQTIAAMVGRVCDVAESFAADLVGIGTMANVYPLVLHMAAGIKNRLPGIPVVLGGHQATFTAAETLRGYPQIDMVVLGEGEVPFPRLVAALEQGRSPVGIEGVACRDNGGIHTPEIPALGSKLDDLGPPAYQLVPDLARYQPFSLVKRANILTSRGCPFGCTFCSVSRFWQRKARFRNAGSVVDELMMLKDGRGAEFIEFADDTFTVNRTYVKAVCTEIIDRGLELEWLCRARANSLDEEMVSLLRRAGCTHVFIGAESGSERILRSIQKKIDPRDVSRAIKLLSRNGLESIVSFIYGFPEETAEDIGLSARLALECRQSGARWISFQRLTALPGTAIASEITEEFNLSGSYVSGSPISTDGAFMEQVQRMVTRTPLIFPSFFRVNTKHFRSEEELMKVVNREFRDLGRDLGMVL